MEAIMARPLRYVAKNVTYHTFTRCRNLNNYFKNDYYKNLIVIVIKETQDVFNFELNDFKIMPNHLHLVITTRNNEHTISKIMQRIKSVIAKRMNKILGFKGPFWNERFGSKIVYFFPALCSYIANNPVRWGLVKDAKDDKYGTFEIYRKKNPACKLKITFHKHFLQLGNSLSDCFKAQMEIDSFYVI